jgi:ribonuclease BN (tRNA processing enzyme)
MSLYVLGAGTPTPTPDRYGSAYVVELGDERQMFTAARRRTDRTALQSSPFHHQNPLAFLEALRAGPRRP